jgi:general secretion pathway protein G
MQSPVIRSFAVSSLDPARFREAPMNAPCPEIGTMSTPNTHSHSCRSRRGFTLVELLMVIVVIALLAALLLPAIGAAVRNANNARVSAEINQMVQALNDFKVKYGDFPPSRIILSETGNYNSTALSGLSPQTTNAVDQTTTALTARSLSFLRKFWPRFQTSTTAAVYPNTPGFFPDFNGNGTQDQTPIILSGDECLVFFLGGIPSLAANNTYGVNGLNRDPTNPFLPPTVINGTQTLSFTNRQPPFFEFASSRLADTDGDGYPSYYDSLGTKRPYAYFSAYGSNAYDPNDVNFDTSNRTPAPLSALFIESDESGSVTPITLKFLVPFPVSNSTNFAVSPPPNPYTSTSTLPANGIVTYQSPQTFQIISAGADGQYGVGGAYVPNADTPLPIDPTTTPSSPYNTTDSTVRVRENDNVTSFHNGKLN